MRNSLRTRLTAAFIALAVVPLFVVGVLLVGYSFTIQRQQALDLQGKIARREAADVAAFLRARENELRALVTGERALQRLGQAERATQLEALLAYQSVYEELTLVDSTGQETFRISRVGTYGVSTLEDRSGQDEFEQPKATGRVYFSPVEFDAITGEPFVTIAVPALNLANEFDGVLVADFRFKGVWALMVNAYVSGSGAVYVVDARNYVVAHESPTVVLGKTKVVLPQAAASLTTMGLSGERVVLAYHNVEMGTQTLRVVAEQPVREALALVRATLLVVVGALVVALGLASGVGVWIAGRLMTPIDELVTTAQAIRAGDLSRQAQVTGQGEIATLAETFNQMTARLREMLAGLEQQVAERTRSLLAAAEVASATTSVLDIAELLPQVVELVRERFDLYYVGLFLTDVAGEYAVLRAGSGAAGQAMLARHHRLAIGGDSMIGRCVLTGQADIQLDVGEAAVHFDNPDLPDTRSEMALPLRARGKVIGAMTVQSARSAAFDEADIAVMQTVAEQVAVAIDNADLFRQAQDSLEATRRAYGELTRDAWQRLLQTRPDLGFISDGQTTVQEVAVWRPEMETALHTGQAVAGQDGAPTLAIPIRVRDQVVGVIDGRKADGTAWSQEEIDLLAAMTDQLSMGLEGAQLYADTQRRAVRERVISEVTGRVRETLDMETMLRTAAAEIRQALSLDRLVVRLGAPEEAGDAPPASGKGRKYVG